MVQDKIGQVILYIMRHGNVAMDSKGTMRGLMNPTLDDKGRKQAEEVAEFFKDIQLSGVVSDDLERTIQTSLPIAEQKHLELQIDVELRSWDVGSDLEGKSIEKNRDAIVRLKTQPWIIPVGGQSWGNYEQQCVDCLDRYMAKGMDSSYPWLITAHGSFIQVVAAHLKFMKKSLEYDETPVEPSGIIAVYLTRAGAEMKILRGAKEIKDE
jgi:broad specificity phosphatase PhoE